MNEVRRRTVLLAPVLALAACGVTPSTPPRPAEPPASAGTAQPAGPALSVRAMTYNVLGGPVPEEWFPLIARAELTPMVRAPGMVAKVRRADPDVLTLQEFQTGSESAAWIEQQLTGYTWVHGPDNHAILARTSRFEVVGTGDSQLNRVGEAGSILDRYVDWARLRDRTSGRTLLVLNVHAHPWQTPALATVRSLAIGRLVEAIAALDPGLSEPLVLMGDFNAGDDEKRVVYRDHLVKLGAAGLVDARRVARTDVSDVPRANSLHQYTAKVSGEWVAKVVRRYDRRIDYVWVPRGTRVDTWQVLSGPGVEWRRVRGERVPVWTGIVPSDHSPVVADLRFAGS